MNASAGSMLVLQILILGGAVLWWAYLAGLVLAGTALMKAGRPVVRIWAGWSLVAQLAPVALALVLFPVFFAELMFNAPIPDGLATLLGGAALLAGPAMSIGLIGVWVLKPKTTNTTASLLVCGALLATLAACGEQEERSGPVPAETAAVETAPPAAAPSPALSIEQSCRQAVEILYGQSGAAVRFDASDFSLSWPAPVDGGRLNFACSVVGSQVTLSNDRQTRTVDLADPAGAARPDGTIADGEGEN